MPISLKAGIDQNTRVVTVSFYDIAGDSVVPTSIVWTMTNGAGTVVNSRSAVVVATPATSVDLLLGEDDMAYSDGPVRRILVEAVYDSTEGTDLPLRDVLTFPIRDLRGV